MTRDARGRAGRTLAFLQAELETIYAVEAPAVDGFLVGRETARAAGRVPQAPEELLVLEEDDGVSLGLYLDDAVMETAAAADPHHPRPRLVARVALARVACAAEGVSHFVYLATRAAAGRPVSLLELEVQAEVDKFALLLLHLWRRGLRRTSRARSGGGSSSASATTPPRRGGARPLPRGEPARRRVRALARGALRGGGGHRGAAPGAAPVLPALGPREARLSRRPRPPVKRAGRAERARPGSYGDVGTRG